MILKPLPASTLVRSPDATRLSLVRTDAAPAAADRPEIPVWHLRVGEVFIAPQMVPGGPMRVEFIGLVPGMRKLFLASPRQPAPSGRLSASDLRLIPHRTLGEDVLVTLVARPAGDSAAPGA